MDDIYNTDPLLRQRAMQIAMGTPVQSPITQPSALTRRSPSQPQGADTGRLQSSYENAVQAQANILANQPHYHGWRKFFDVLGQMSPIGRGIETAAGIGTLGYQRRLGQAEQNVDRLGRQLNQDPMQRYQALQAVQGDQAIPLGWNLQPNDAQQNDDQSQENHEDGQDSPYQNPINEIGLGVYDSPQNLTISALSPGQTPLKKKEQTPRELWTFYS